MRPPYPARTVNRPLTSFVLMSLLLLLCSPGFLQSAGSSDVSPPLALPELEKRMLEPDEVLIAAADLEAGQAQLAQQRNEQGMKLFAGAGTGLAIDTALSGSDRQYTTYDIRAGLRYPLLGRADAEQRGVVAAETVVREKEQRLQLARRQCLSLLRLNYVSYWAAQEKERLNAAFLAGESGQQRLLAKRQRAGYLLESDRLEFLSAFDLVRRNQDNLHAVQRTALHILQRLTGTGILFSARAPVFALTAADSAELAESAAASYPTVVLLRERLQGLAEQAPLTRHSGTNANVDIYTASGVDDTQNAPEYSVGVNFSVEIPAGNLTGSVHPAQRSVQAQAIKCRRELVLERETIRTRVLEAQALNRASASDNLLAVQRLRAAAERVRENGLRTAMEGDALERLQQSRYVYYQVAVDAVDAQARQWNNQIALLEYVDLPASSRDERQVVTLPPVTEAIDLRLLSAGAGGSPKNELERAEPTVPADARAATVPDFTVNSLYVWHTAELQAKAASDPDFWNRLQAAGIRRLLLSLNQSQLDALVDPSDRAKFSGWLRQVEGRGIAVELLLGEPLWILPEHRPKLLAIITALADLPFSGLHLDLEPDQLSNRSPKGHRSINKEWIATVAAAKGVSPWPLGVSMHPRYFASSGKRSGLGTAMFRMGVAEVILMTYVVNPARVAEVVNPILRRTPELHFSVAQSVEPELSAEESHYHAGRERFNVKMKQLAPLLNAQNFNGIVVQDWSRWQEMKP